MGLSNSADTEPIDKKREEIRSLIKGFVFLGWKQSYLDGMYTSDELILIANAMKEMEKIYNL